MPNTVAHEETAAGVPPTDEIAAFVAVAELASFTRAAARLGNSKSSVGKAVQRLEARLGARLLRRSTGAVSLTEEGALYLEAARAALGSLVEAGRVLATRQGEPAGHLRLDLPAGLGRVILPTLAGFAARHPRLTLEVVLADRFSDPIAEGWDVVVRVGFLADSSLVARKLCDLRLGFYAAPAYLARRGVPHAPEDLPGHEAILFRGPDGRLRPWLLDRDGARVEIAPPPCLILSDGYAVVEAACAGFGIAQAYDATCAAAVAAGNLVPVLPELAAAGPPVHALLPGGPAGKSAKICVLLEHLAAVLHCGERPLM